MRVVVITGGRDYPDGDAVRYALAGHQPDILIHGACPSGVDWYAAEWAKNNAVPVLAWPADWDRHGRKAGPLRNEDMVAFAAQLVRMRGFVETCVGVVFPGGRGTAHCAKMMEKYGIPMDVRTGD